MKGIVTPARTQAPCRAAAPARGPAFRAAPRRSVRAHAASDVGKYLSEAARQIFLPQANDVPWEASTQAFTGKIVHHEETARLKALELQLESAAKEIQGSMDEAAPEPEETVFKFDDKGNPVADEGSVGHFVMSSIQRVFGNNFKGDETEPKAWVSTGYKASGRHRSQRNLRHEYDRLQRFQSVVKATVAKVEAEVPKPKLETSNRDM